jgi:hypothetical protein
MLLLRTIQRLRGRKKRQMTNKPLISFDYAIKYLLKDKGEYEIVEGFISLSASQVPRV